MSQPEKAEVWPRQPLTERQRQLLNCIEQLWTYKGPPTIRDLVAATGLKSTNGVAEHLDALARKGWIIMQDGPAHRRRKDSRSGILRLTHAETWPWWTINIQGLSAEYLTSIQAPDWALAAVWAREDWHAIGAPDALSGVEISLSPRTAPEFEGWLEVAS